MRNANVDWIEHYNQFSNKDTDKAIKIPMHVNKTAYEVAVFIISQQDTPHKMYVSETSCPEIVIDAVDKAVAYSVKYHGYDVAAIKTRIWPSVMRNTLLELARLDLAIRVNILQV